MAKLQLIGKIAVIVSSALLALVGVTRFFNKTTEIQYYIMAAYLVIFAAIAITAIIPVAFVNKYFAFLDGPVGLGIFLVFAGLLVLNWSHQLELFTSLCLLASGGYNIVIGSCYTATS